MRRSDIRARLSKDRPMRHADASMPRHFETVRRGVLRERAGSGVSFGVRVVREASTPWYRVVVGSSLQDKTWASLDEASLAHDNAAWAVVWHEQVAAAPNERACFVCGAGLGELNDTRVRYPSRLCFVCLQETVDERGRHVRFRNEDMSGGFIAIEEESGAQTDNHVCYVRGIACWADEAYGGGIVVTPQRR